MASGVELRSDIVDVYLFRRSRSGAEFLQMLRSEEPMKGTWHPIMGHMHEGEDAVSTALRELKEETGLGSRVGVNADGVSACGMSLGMWALEQVHPFFIARLNCIVFSPRFVVEVGPGWEPVLNEEHEAARWVLVDGVSGAGSEAFVWPGQRASVREVMEHIVRGGSQMEGLARV